MYQVIASSRIVINSHIDQVGNYAANMRLFEVTGAGSCLVTDYKDNISDYFDDNTEIITYKNTEELVSKVKYLLSNEHIRKEIADRGQKRTLICHNYQLRFEKFANYLFEIYNKS